MKKIALANPATAPYGLAGKQALERAGLWNDLQDRIVLADSVGQALLYAQKGDAEAALVGRAIARVPDVRAIELDQSLYDPIIQSLGIVSASEHATEAQRFVAFVLGEEGQSLLKEAGFTPAQARCSNAGAEPLNIDLKLWFEHNNINKTISYIGLNTYYI